MTKVIIDTDLTEPVFADDGDRFVVAEAGSVLTEDDYAITNRTSDDAGITYVIRGAVSGGVIGLFQSDTSATGTTQITVAPTGTVSGKAGIAVVNDTSADLRIAGTVTGSFDAIELATPLSTLHVSGELTGTRYGLLLNTSDYKTPSDVHTIVNTGLIRGEAYAGIALTQVGGTIRNYGEISGFQGIAAERGLALTIRNEGLIHADTSEAIHLAVGKAPALVNNLGTISSEGVAISLVDSDAKIFNSGTITGEVVFGFYDQETLRLVNSGEITGTDCLVEDYSAGDYEIVNRGTITGDLRSEDGNSAWRILNHGVYDGQIAFGYRDCLYDGRDGTVTGRVSGGLGNDLLIGGDGAETFVGSWGDDRLQGRGGDDSLDGSYDNDILKGGEGDDLLDGGAGDDRLRGDAGADIFVFGADAGDDTVTDFETGTDLLRLTDQSGGFASLTITDHGRDLMVSHDGGTILLAGLAGTTLTAADFDFA